MSSVIVTVDIVGSTNVKFRFDQSTAARKITAALNRVRDALVTADESLRCPAPYAGDSILLVGGLNPVEIYRAAVLHQAKFRAWEYERLPVKITLGFGMFETVKGDRDGHVGHHGRDLDELYAVAAWCPPAAVIVTQSMYSVLEDADYRYARRFHERIEHLKGFGERAFYISNGDYRPPKPKRKRRTLVPQNRGEFTRAVSIASIGAIVLMALLLYLHGGKL